MTYYVFGNKHVDIDYLFFFFKSVNLPKLAVGVKPGINRNRVYEIEIPLPPVGEQKKIVARIEKQFAKIDEVARLRAVSEATTAALLPAALHEIFSSAESKGWEIVTFGNESCMQIVDGDRGKNYPSKIEFSPNGFCLFLNTSNVRQGDFNFSRMDFISKEKDELLRKGKMMRGDVVLTTRGTLGNTAYYGPDVPYEAMRINSGMVILRVNPHRILQDYLLYIMNSNEFVQAIKEANSGSAQPQLPIKVLSKLTLPLPPLAEQKKIVKKLDVLAEKVRALQTLQSQQAADLKALKQSILHEAFTGK